MPESKIVVNGERRNTSSNITSIAVINNQLIIYGVGFKGATALKLKNSGLDQSLAIESVTNNKIVANAKTAFAIGLNQAFDLIISSAAGAATFPITFTLSDGSVTATKLAPMGAGVGEVMKFNGTTWVPTPLTSGQLYIGSWNASLNNPDVNAATPQPGDYYIVTVGGTQNLGSGPQAYAIGDWIMYNGTTWDIIQNSINVVGSFKGRRGVVVPATGDYTWSQITKTGSKLEDIADIDITGKADQKILKWDTASSKWVMGVDNAGASAFSGTASKVVVTNGSGALSTSATSSTELGYVAGVTSAIQAQLNAKASTTLSSAYIMIGNGSNVATGVAMSGDATITNAGVITLKNTGTAGTYTSVTTDNQGRVTAGTNGSVVTSITATAPVAITTSSTPVISMAAATGSVNGYLTSTDWTTFNGKQAALSYGATINGIVYPANASETLKIPLAPAVATDAVNKQYVDSLTGQWTTAAGDIYRATGNVGVGTSTPGSSLDVKGTLRLSGSTSGYVGFAPQAIAGATTYILPATQGTAGQVLTTNGTATTPTLSWTTPAAAAPVTSVNTQTGAVVLTTTDVAEGSNLYSTNARTISATLTGFAAGANSTILATDTVLGAFQKVQGQISAKEPAITAGTTAQYIRGDKTLSTFATDAINSALTGLSTATTTAVTATDSILVGMGKLQGQVSSHTTNLATKADVTNVTQTITALAVTGLGAPVAGSDAVNKTYVDAATAGANAWTVASGNVYRATGNVGIGTTTPSANLHVAGTSLISGSAIGNAQGVWTGWNNSTLAGGTGYGMAHIVNHRGGGQGGFTFNDTADGATFKEYMRIDNYGRIGVGTSTPTSLLDVTFGSSGGEGGAVQIRNSSESVGSYAILKFKTTYDNSANYSKGGIAYVSLGAYGKGDMYFLQNSAGDSSNASISDAAMVLKNDGKLGIGTTAPGSALDVKGTLRLSGATSGYVGFAPAAAAGATTYTLPATQGTAGQVLSTNGVATTPTLTWITPSATSAVTSVNTQTGAVVLTTSDIAEGTNLYSTNARTIASTLTGYAVGTNSVLAATDTVLGAFQKVQGQISAKEPAITAGTTAQYIRGDKSLSTFATDAIASALTGLSTATTTAVTATDSILVGMGKLQGQVSGNSTSLASKADVTNVTQTITALAVTGLGAPVAGSDAVNKTYVDGLASPWTTAAGNVYRATGNVGIGTATPGFPLAVEAAYTGLNVKSAQSNSEVAILEGQTNPSLTLFTNGGGATDSFNINFKSYNSNPGIVDISRITSTQTANGVGAHSGYMSFSTSTAGSIAERMRISETGKVGIGTTTPTALLQLKAGTAAANTAPLKLTSGTNLTTPEAGAIEFDGTSLYYTTNGGARQTLGISGAGITNLNGLTGSSQTFGIGATGTAPAFSSATSIHTLNIPMAATASVTAGLLSNADYVVFNDKAPLAGPTFTGVPLAPTAAINTNTTQIATTAFVVGQAATVAPLIDGTATVGTSLLYTRQDHVHPTDSTRAPAAGSASITTLGTVTAGVWNATTITVANGGTGLTSGTLGGIPWYVGTGTIASSSQLLLNGIVLGGGTTAPGTIGLGTGGQVLTSNGVGGPPTWQASSGLDATKLPLAGGTMTGALVNNTNNSSPSAAVAVTQAGTGYAATFMGGNVGIGTTTPTTPLHVVKSGGDHQSAIFESNCSGCDSFMTVANAANSIGGSTASVLFSVAGTGYVGGVSGKGSGGADGHLVFSTLSSGNLGERVRITNTGNMGIGTTAPGSALDVKGTLRLSGATSGYVGFAAAAAAGATTYTLPTTQGSAGQVLSTNGVATTPTLSWVTPASAPVTSVNTQTGAVVLTTSDIAEGSNLYLTNARTIGATLTGFAAGANSTILATDTVLGALQKTQGQINAKEPAITAGTTAQYLRGDKSLSTFASDVWATVLTGLSTATNSAIAATDTILIAFGKLQAQISSNTTSLAGKADTTNIAQTITALAVTGLGAPVAGSDAANKTYVDAAAGTWTVSGSDAYRSGGNVGIGTTAPGSALDVKGTLRLSGSTSGYVGFAPAAAAGSTTYTLPTTQGTAGQVLTTNGTATTPTLSWTTPAGGGGVTSVNGSSGVVLLTSDDINEGSTNLYSTNARTIGATLTGFTAGANSTILAADTVLGALQKTQGQINAKEPAITAGTTAQYLRGDKSLATFATDVRASVLTGLSTATNSAVVAADTILAGIGKLQAQISGNATSISGKADTTNVTQTITALAVTGLGAPSAGSDAANKTYVDGLAGTWTVASGNAYRATGSVGVGTASPSESIETTGNVKAVGFISTSDIRLKKNITKTVGLAKVLKLEGVEYDWKKSGEHDYGLIAQAVELIFPHAVVTDSVTGYKAIKYSNLISPVIEAIKDLYKMIVHTNDEVTVLKREIASVKEKNEQLEEDNAMMRKEFSEMKKRMDLIEKNKK